MGERDDEDDDVSDEVALSRRRLLKGTGVALSTLALGSAACSDEDPAASSGAPGSPDGGEGAGSAAPPASGSGAPAGGGSSGSGSGGGGASTGTAGSAPGAGGSSGVPSADGGTVPTPVDGGSPPSGRVTVAIVRRAGLPDAVARAVELAGGLSAIQPGQNVFIKINAVSDRAIGTPGIRTSNEMIAAVVALVKQRNPGHIVVGDRSARQFPDTEAVFANAGIGDAALGAGADEVYAAPSPADDPDAWMQLQPTGYEGTWGSAGGILCMRRILEADHLINVPTCKNHRYALFTLSMKCFIGAIGDPSRDPLHFAESFGANFSPIGRDIAVLNQPFTPLMNILDATTALINGGPQGDGTDAVRASPGLVLASRDRVALDAAGIALIKLHLGRTDVPQPDGANARIRSTNPFEFPQIVEASSLGLGVGRAADVELAFDDVPDQAELEAIYNV